MMTDVRVFRRFLLGTLRDGIKASAAEASRLRAEEKDLKRQASSGPERHRLTLRRRWMRPKQHARLSWYGMLRGRSAKRSGIAGKMDAQSAKQHAWDMWRTMASILGGMDYYMMSRWHYSPERDLTIRWLRGEADRAEATAMLEVLQRLSLGVARSVHPPIAVVASGGGT